MVQMLEKGIVGILTLIVIFYMANPLVTALTGVDLSNVSGQDLSWIPGLVGIVFFVAIVLSVYKDQLRGTLGR
jgi:hypothetical protein